MGKTRNVYIIGCKIHKERLIFMLFGVLKQKKKEEKKVEEKEEKK